MNLHSRSWILGMTVFVSWATAGAGQQSMPPSAPQQPTLSKRPPPPPGAAEAARRIRLDIVVTDAAGKPVSGLEQKDFKLLDNGQPGNIVAFGAFDGGEQQSEPWARAQVIMLLDSVNVGIQYVTYARQEVSHFLRIGIGGAADRSPLPHHRTSGSAYGGSRS